MQHVQILYADKVIRFHELSAFLMQEVRSLMTHFLLKDCDPPLLSVIPVRLSLRVGCYPIHDRNAPDYVVFFATAGSSLPFIEPEYYPMYNNLIHPYYHK